MQDAVGGPEAATPQAQFAGQLSPEGTPPGPIGAVQAAQAAQQQVTSLTAVLRISLTAVAAHIFAFCSAVGISRDFFSTLHPFQGRWALDKQACMKPTTGKHCLLGCPLCD